ncbi:MAG: hypothetical protein OQK55_01885, partial [Thermoanaerobaculales bacterium]|nr:hypothetical protein [Thermoanaerobaculales bacterium]
GDSIPPEVPEGLQAIRVRSKVDLAPGMTIAGDWLGLSCHSGEGLEEFRDELLRRVLGEVPDLGGAVAIAARHRRALEEAASELNEFDVGSPETAAENVRWALRAVDALIGEISTDDVLDEIYSSFCIGK